MPNSFLIAAPWSNSGKTTITLGLLRFFKNKGYKVQPFKCGPDYIDTLHHSTAAKTQSINLDTFLMSEKHLKEVFFTYSTKANINIIEGAMGLFDGAVKDKGSAADIAKKLNVPIVLIINANAMAYSVAPILYGLKTFDAKVKIAGVIFNFVKTKSHYSFLKEACKKVGVTALGYIPPNKNLEIPSRHLGLYINSSFEKKIEKTANYIGKQININKLIKCVETSNKPATLVKTKPKKSSNTPTVLIAKDSAFTFTYAENINYFKKFAEVTFFSPLKDKKLPKANLIYLPGGYPELYAKELAKNTKMQKAIKEAAENNTQIFAEGGGMMYLGKSIITEKGEEYPMANVFNFSTSMQKKKLQLGYRKVILEKNELWGHEFHYSKIINSTEKNISTKVFTARNKEIKTKLYQYKNVLASYIHLYWAEGNFKWLSKNLKN